jgi:hypothetical protein
VRQAFAAEKPHLLTLPDNPYPAEDLAEVAVGRTPYVRFDLNDYSVPADFVRRTLVVLATLDTVRILHGNDVIASHPRSWSRGEQIEDPAHVRDLLEAKCEARRHRGLDRLQLAAPSATKLFLELAQRGGNLGSATAGLLRLLDSHGSTALEAAIAETLARDTPHLAAIRHILDRKRHEQGQPPALPVALPDDPRVRDLAVRPHRLEDYEQIHKETDDDHDPEPEA